MSFIKKSVVFILTINLLLVSCTSKKDVVYFQNAKSFETAVDTDTFVPRFKVDDNVSIFVSTFDLELVKPFNLAQGSESLATPVTYLIDVDGNIDYPVLGKIKLLGLTVEEAKELLKEKLEIYLKDPIVNIRILNFEITVLGEVNRPGTYPITGERVSLLKALGMAGDLTIKGRRDNILIVRDFNGEKTYTRLDITSKEVFNSPVYFLTQNDVVYVSPNKSRISGASGDTRVGLILSLASFIVGIGLLVTRSR